MCLLTLHACDQDTISSRLLQMKNPAHKLHSLLPSTVSQIRERETRFNEDNIYNFNYKPEHFRIRCEWQPPCSNLKKWQCCYNLLTSLLQSLLRTHVVDKLWDLYVRSTTLTFFVLVVSEDLVGQGELTTSSASQIFHDRRSWTRWKNRIFKWFSRTDNCRFTPATVARYWLVKQRMIRATDEILI